MGVDTEGSLIKSVVTLMLKTRGLFAA